MRFYWLELGVTIARKVLLWIHRRILKRQIYLKTKYKIIFIWLKIHLHIPIRATKRGGGIARGAPVSSGRNPDFSEFRFRPELIKKAWPEPELCRFQRDRISNVFLSNKSSQ